MSQPIACYTKHYADCLFKQVLDKSLPLRLAMQGPIGVDLFLVLTGMWATAHLVPALELASLFDNVRGSLWRAVRRYYNKRARRVLPRYVTALLMVAFAIDHTKVSFLSFPFLNVNDVFSWFLLIYRASCAPLAVTLADSRPCLTSQP